MTAIARPATEFGDDAAQTGVTLIVADEETRLRLLSEWTAGPFEHGAVGLVRAKDLPMPVPVVKSAEAEASQERALASAHEAMIAAQAALDEAVEGLRRRELAADAALGVISPKAIEASKIDKVALEEKIARLEEVVGRGHSILDRLLAEVNYDDEHRHPLQPKIVRVNVANFETRIGGRRSILSDAANLGLIDSGAAANLDRVLGSIKPEQAVDAFASDLLERADAIVARKVEWDALPQEPALLDLDRKISLARVEASRIEQSSSSAGGGLSIIEQALHMVLDEKVSDDSDTQQLRAKALKREMLDGPGSFIDQEAMASRAGQASDARLVQARQAVQRLERERDVLMAKREAKHGRNPAALLETLGQEAAPYLQGRPVGELRSVVEQTRILPCIPPGLKASLHGGVQRAIAQLAAVRKEADAVDRVSAGPSFGSRTAAMRAVADLEAHRRETAKAEQKLALAQLALEQVESEAADWMPVVAQEDAMLAFLEEKLTEVGRDVLFVFDDTFCELVEPVKSTALEWLLQAAEERPLLYMTADDPTVAWAEDHHGVLSMVRM